ncbi:MAG: DNA repair protein RecN [Desulfuromonadales bacterium]|nr:DNA repair protein RecN [Desulfuromonadales bacterium]
MLLELIIKNFAIIDRLHVTFGSGFNVLTGETGAGKSIIIDAVGLLCGDRARPDFIRHGEEEATVEAVFMIAEQTKLRSLLGAAGYEDGEELLVKRVISRSGKNRVFVNGSMATLTQLSEFTVDLLTIYGQNEHQNLLRSDRHLALLDSFAGTAPLVAECAAQFRQLKEIRSHLERLNTAEREQRQRLDLLSFQRQEIDDAALHLGEDDELSAERRLLHNAEKLSATTHDSYEKLYGDNGALCEELGRVATSISELGSIDPALTTIAENLSSALYTLEDVALELRRYSEKISFDPQRQTEVDERLTLLTTLKRKYAGTLDEILAYRKNIETEIEELFDLDASRDRLLLQRDEMAIALDETAATLSVARRAAAQQLRQAVETELHELAMPKALFSIQLHALAEPGATGAERGEFLLAPNPGEDPKPLIKIASGGELSRIMLALNRVAPDSDRGATLIFDEVDAGIGGQAATAVGEKLRAVACHGQALCITHLPQVAAFADHHYRVEKQVEDGRTTTTLSLLDEHDRVEEMARMLGGAKISATTREHAREIIRLSSANVAEPGD